MLTSNVIASGMVPIRLGQDDAQWCVMAATTGDTWQVGHLP